MVELYELLVAEQPLELTEEEIASFENDEDEIEEAKRLKYEERQKLSDDDFAVVITVKNKVTGEPRKIRMFPIYDEAHVRNALARLAQEKVKETLKRLGVSIEEVEKKILKKAKELNMTDLLKRYEKSEETKPTEETKPAETGAETKPEGEETKEAQVMEQPAEPKKLVKIVTEESVIVTEIPEENGSKVEKKGLRKRTCSYSDGTEEINTEEYQVVDTYTLAQVEEKVTAIKTEKDAEITTLKTEKEKEISDLKTTNEELDKEIKKLQDELGKKDQEIAELKTPKVIEKKEKELTVGVVEGEKDSEIKKQAANINKIIAEGKGKG